MHFPNALNAGMVELADTPDLGSGAKACRFKSCYPHHFKSPIIRAFFFCQNIILIPLP